MAQTASNRKRQNGHPVIVDGGRQFGYRVTNIFPAPGEGENPAGFREAVVNMMYEDFLKWCEQHPDIASTDKPVD